MTLQEIQQAIDQLSAEEQLVLLDRLMRTLKTKQKPPIDRHALVSQLQGCLHRPGQSIPSDTELESMRDERLVEKYLV
ncbi:hypothetical protein [Acaryochloris sp. IP29b_bin.148]|uniref:hypothetical protein n=1 Tax=Acaryochloris sp. IP29b_bin.148 TaxID=2969218 RepID=UPI00260FC004|nr:hypothetical protein [Acaryochloris sp. IP29b_bin.148]